MIPKRHRRREPLELQLTAMIDIFAMLVIFLLKSSVFGVVDVQVPQQIKLPESFSKETVETTPKVLISEETVGVPFIDRSDVPLNQLEGIKPELKAYLAKQPKDASSVAATLSVIADKGVPYRKIYDVVKVFRESGFGNVMFIASGKNGN
jgi:biopolymer transport protein ExbD